MKKINNILPILLSFFLMVSSCGKLDEVKNPLDGFKLIIDYDIFNTFISFRFIDTSTGELIGATDGSSVAVSITGQHKDGVVGQLGESKSEHLSFSGLLTLALNPKDPYVPSSGNLIQFIVNANYEGYRKQSLNVVISEEGNYSFEVYLEKEETSGGVREYYREFNVGSNGTPNDSIKIASLDNESFFILPDDAVLLDSASNIISNEEVGLWVTIYENFNLAPIPQSLVVETVEGDQVSQQSFDIVSLVKVKMRAGNSIVSSIKGASINLNIPLKEGVLNPITWENFAGGQKVKTWELNKENAWVNNNEEELKEHGGRLFLSVATNRLSFYAGAVTQPLCIFAGNAIFSLDENFIMKPVSPSLYCYREADLRYLGHIPYTISGDLHNEAFEFYVPQNNRLLLEVVNRDNTNSFKATPSQRLIHTPCVDNRLIQILLEPTSMDYNGSFVFNFLEEFPNEEFQVRASFYDVASGKHLLSQDYLVSDGKKVEVSTTMQQASSLKVTFSALNPDNSFTATPNEIIIQEPQVQGQEYQVALSPEKCLLSGTFEFNFSGQFPSGDIDFKVEVRDETTNNLIENIYLKCSETELLVPFNIVLAKSERAYLKVKRVVSGTKFHVAPYEFSIGDVCQKGLTWNVDISPVEMITVDINVKAVCPDTEIIPTLTGYYRLVWDEEWNEVELVYGNTTLDLEKNGTYEMGIIVDGELVSEIYTITGPSLNLEFDLDQDQCDKFGY